MKSIPDLDGPLEHGEEGLPKQVDLWDIDKQLWDKSINSENEVPPEVKKEPTVIKFEELYKPYPAPKEEIRIIKKPIS